MTDFLTPQSVVDFHERETYQVAEIAQALDEANAGDFASDNDVAVLREKLSDYAP